MSKQENTEEDRMRESMIRGSLPLAWLATLSSTVLLYSMSTTDPDFGEIIAKLQSPFALLAAVLVLSFVTFSFGLPTRRELVSGTLVGVAGGAAVIIVASVASFGLFLIAAFFYCAFVKISIPLANDSAGRGVASVIPGAKNG